MISNIAGVFYTCKKEAYFLSILLSVLNIFVLSDLRMAHSMG